MTRVKIDGLAAFREGYEKLLRAPTDEELRAALFEVGKEVMREAARGYPRGGKKHAMETAPRQDYDLDLTATEIVNETKALPKPAC